MKPRHTRLMGLLAMLALLALAGGLVLKAFRQNLVFFVTPSEIARGEAPAGSRFRLGGLVAPGSVQRFHHIPDFIEDAERVRTRTIGVMRRKERNRLIAPVVRTAGRRRLRIELKDRQQLHRGDAEILQVWDLLDKSCVRPSLTRRDAGTRMPGEASDVHLVNDGFSKRMPERCISFPVVSRWIGHHALHRVSGIRSGADCPLPVVLLWYRDREPIRIKEHFFAVEPTPAIGRERTLCAIGVHLSMPEAGNERVPVVVGAVPLRMERDDVRRLGRIAVIEQQQLDKRCIL